MASTYSNLKIQLMATGENSGTWGNVTNVNLGTAIEQAMVETATVTFASANVTLTLTDTNAAQNARALRLNLTGTTGGARDLIVPAVQKPYIVNNGTADTITIKVSGQTGVPVPASKTMLVYNNGTDVVAAINHLSALSLDTPLPITSGGTGTNATTFANLESNVSGTLPVANGGTSAATLDAESVVVGNGTSAVKFVAPGTDGNVLTSNGTAWVSEAIVIPPSVPTGTIATFAGDPGAGWLECNGQVVSQSTYSDLYSKVGLIVDGLRTNSVGIIVSPTPGYSGIAYNVAYGNSTYVAGVFDGEFAYIRHYTSTDAVTWTARSFGWVSGMSAMRALIYAGGQFVAGFSVGGTAATNRNNIATSTDGITWTVRTFSTASVNISSLAYNGSVYVAGITVFGINGVSTSTDGITWTARTLAVQSSENVVGYGNNLFVLLGGVSTSYGHIIHTSTDGITWTYRSGSFNHYAFGPAPVYDGEKFWTAGQVFYQQESILVYTSTDGITWPINTALSSVLPRIQSFAYDSSSNILYAYSRGMGAVSGGNKIAVSKDKGLTWQVTEVGGLILPTTTDGYLVANEFIFPGTFSRSIFVANGKVAVAGYVRVFSTAGAQYEWGAVVIRDPYSYQTDTQFVVPAGSSFTSYGTGRMTGGFKDANNIGGPLGSDLKYYIKT